MNSIIISEKWYQKLIEDIVAINEEEKIIATHALIKSKWLIGDRILSEHDNWERAEIYGEEIVRCIGQSLTAARMQLIRDIGGSEENLSAQQIIISGRLGELLKGIPDKYSTKFHGGKLVSLPKGITHKQSHYAQEIKKHLGELLPPPSFQRGKDGRVTGHSTEIVSVGNGSYKTICIDPPWPRSNLIMHIEMF